MSRPRVMGYTKLTEQNFYKIGKPVYGVKAVVSSKSGRREEKGKVVYKRKVDYREKA
ncbi:hypothetical protein NSA56_06585 [Oceanobacillus caeni]|uniref:hypothetical protein n=1 Tax=Bacillaceae TaxID=186817 RepID=UPI000AFE584A|nr:MULTISPECIES: hypothetical protein [Bacillaceae]MCR1834058.1 hypothetical protein [Oceanobacillus caeni]